MKIKQLRLMNNMSQKEFAKSLGIAQNTLSNYENELRTPDPAFIKKVAEMYHVTTDYLLDADQICDDRMGDALRSERELQGYTLQELSRETKIPQNDLRDYEDNLEPINLYLFSRICDLYGMSEEYFYVNNDMYDEYIPEIFDGDVDKYTKFKKAQDEDAQNPAMLSYGLPTKGYYNDPKVTEIAEAVHKDPNLRILFDASKDMTTDDISMMIDLAKGLKKRGQVD